MSETYKDHGHPPGWENEHDPRCQACAQSELASSGGSLIACDSAIEWLLTCPKCHTAMRENSSSTRGGGSVDGATIHLRCHKCKTWTRCKIVRHITLENTDYPEHLSR